MEIKFYPYTLKLKHTFTISAYSRNSTPAVLIEISEGEFTGYGEISMPQYLRETVETAAAFLKKTDLSRFNIQDGLENIIEYIDTVDEGNTAAKAGLDIALHDLYGKMNRMPVRRIYSIEGNESPKISFTIGIDTEENLIKKIAEAGEFEFLKIKLGSSDDKKIIETIRKVTDKKILVDVNQGWKEKEYALDMICCLSERDVILVEQPLDKNRKEDQRWLMERSPLPIFADEAIQRLSGLESIRSLYNGINIKLMKCTGIREAFRLLKSAKEYGMLTMLGCMTETSCAISAAAQLSPLADYADLDGNLLISNDPFTGLDYKEGRIMLNNFPGLGVKKNN
jgi:L-alanine-DL-glutamate epimerase-like enolase superfamily enzyme